MRSIWRDGRASAARAASSTRCCARSRARRAVAAAAAAARPIRPTATRRSTTSSITLSHPRWLVARWYDRLGFDATEAWLQFNNTPAPLTLRANRLQTTRDELAERLAGRRASTSRPTALRARRADRRRRASARAALAATQGWFVVQDEASQLVALLAGDRAGPRVLDTCASPGGKTTAIAAAMDGRGLLVACDVRDRRIELLRRTVAASGAANVRLVQADLLQPLPFSRAVRLRARRRAVLGPRHAPARSRHPLAPARSGSRRRSPPRSWRCCSTPRTPSRRAAGSIYATCSSEPEENEGVVDAFLATTPGFAPVARRAGVVAARRDARRRARPPADAAATCTASKRSSAPCSNAR